MTIKDIMELGGTGVLTIMVWRLWQRLETLTDRIFTYLEEGRADREQMAKAQGLTTQDLRVARKEALDKLNGDDPRK